MNQNNDISPEEFELIESYLLNTMTDSEKETFESKLSTDETLREKVEDYRALLKAIESQSLKEKLDAFHDESIEQTDVVALDDNFSSSTSWYKTYGIAASLIVFIGLASLWYFNQPSASEKLYNDYFSPDPGLPTLMSNSNENFEFYDAMVTYKQGDYDSAITKWNTLLEAKPQNDTLNYFIGVAKMANKEVEEAIKHLEVVTESDTNSFKNEAHYYLGLAYLQIDNIELAKKNLNFSSIDNSKALLSELND
ncbi:tetratricopeptide repeat protein [Winogradskyella sp. 3972H.M.0a.05]|uniref:tetratricopeptide repeat protein n=1 Tax=Winogradskyella sp. 3972H.M.0a.05 TaxID=2950277 RepID=UPI00339A7BFE